MYHIKKMVFYLAISKNQNNNESMKQLNFVRASFETYVPIIKKCVA
jgi:hypothetical protein